MQFIDLHTHRPAGAPDVLEIESLYFGQAASKDSSFYSAGLHPWYLQDIDLKAATDWLWAQADQPDCLAIGEAGLDKITKTPWALQVEAFTICLQVAAESGKPLIIHCVRAYGEILQLLNRPPAPVHRRLHTVFHGFDKHPQTAGMLLDAGCYLSFGTALFRENSRAAEVLRGTPANRFLLETDDMNLDIKAVYARAAEVRGVPGDQIKEQVWLNFHALTGQK